VSGWRLLPGIDDGNIEAFIGMCSATMLAMWLSDCNLMLLQTRPGNCPCESHKGITRLLRLARGRWTRLAREGMLVVKSEQ
jgi:hypothetical protein